jgi:hypothetical protein
MSNQRIYEYYGNLELQRHCSPTHKQVPDEAVCVRKYIRYVCMQSTIMYEANSISLRIFHSIK